MHRAEGQTGAPPEPRTIVADGDPIGGWFGAIVRRTALDAGEVEIPAPRGAGPSDFARIAMAADTVGAMVAYLTGQPSIATANLELHLVADQVAGAIIARGQPIRVGRRQVLVAITISDASGRVVARGIADNAVLNLHLAMYYSKFAIVEERHLGPQRAAPLGALMDIFGDGAGDLVVDERSKNPLDAVHGGILASFAESAARRAGIATTEDCVIRYLHPARRGPIRASVRDVSARANSTYATVELRDSDDVVVVTAAVSGRPDPSSARQTACTA